MTSNTPSPVRFDGPLLNALSGMGTGRDVHEATQVNWISSYLGEMACNSLYMQSWLCRKVVELFPADGTREGWDLSLGQDATKATKKKLAQLQMEGEELRLRDYIRTAASEARLTGGAALLLLVDDGRTDVSRPINWRKLKRIVSLAVLDRWRIRPATGWSGVGTPEAYEFDVEEDEDLKRRGFSGAIVRVHASRVIRFEGDRVPHRLRAHFDWWGASALQALWDSFKRWGAAINSASGIVNDFNMIWHRVPDLQRMILAGKEQDIRDRLRLNHMTRSVMGAFLLGDGEEIGELARTASGIPDILDRLRDEITGATGIPHTKLWGESPSGLGADGRSEDRGWAGDVSAWQQDNLAGALRQFYGTMMRCSDHAWGGGELPDEWGIEFRPIIIPSEDEKADLMSKAAQADSQYIQAGVLRPNEVALARFGKPEFSLNTDLIDREEDGSIPEEDNEGMPAFGGAWGAPDPNAPPQPGGQPGQPGAAPPGQPGQPEQEQEQEPPRTDADDAPCCESCGRGEECEADCEGGSCDADPDDPDQADEHEDGKQPADPKKHRHPDKVGQVMHRWKHGTLHSGTGRKGEHRGEVDYPSGQKQAIAIALSMAGKSRKASSRRRRRKTRSDAASPGPRTIAGVPVLVMEGNVGEILGAYGRPTGLWAAIGPDDEGCWEVRGDAGTSAFILGLGAREDAEAAAEGQQIRPLDEIDFAAIGVRCDAYTDEQEA